MRNTKLLAKRERQIAELIAWGASMKEIAAMLCISIRTVDNTLRKVKEKLMLNKNTEISAWWFCTNYNISMDLSPLARRNIAGLIMAIFLHGEMLPLSFQNNYIPHRITRRVQREIFLRRNASIATSFCVL